MIKSLCINCDNLKICNWKRKDLLQCNEHKVTIRKVNVPVSEVIINVQAAQSNFKAKGICATCVHLSTCTLRTEGLAMSYCEEFL